MHVLIDLHWLQPGRVGGSETVARGFLQALLALGSGHRYTLCVPTAVRYTLDLPEHPDVRTVTMDGPVQALRRFLGLPRFRRLEADVGLSLVGYIHPDLADRPYVLVVLDIQHEYRPEFFSPQELLERQYLFTKSIRRAAHVCAVSEFTRRTLLERYELPPEAVTTVYPAADPIFKAGSPFRGRAWTVLPRYGLTPGTYLLYPAHTWPHKNHLTLLTALDLLRTRYGDTPLLVCTGQPKGAHAAFMQAVRERGLETQVRWLGYCPRTDMPALYEGAWALVFPSLFEGFGFPVLEAMHCGCPVLCSDTTSLPEIAGDAALCLDPLNPAAWADAIHRILTDPGLRADLIRRGQDRAAGFSWMDAGRTLLRVLEAASGSPAPGAAGHRPADASPSLPPDTSVEPRRRRRRPPRLRRFLAAAVYPRFQEWARRLRNALMWGLDRWRRVPTPTRRLLDHPEPWWDGWAGPRLVLLRRTQEPVSALQIRGWRGPFPAASPLVLTVILDGTLLAEFSVYHAGPFEWRTVLSRPLPPGLHVLEIRSRPYWIPDRWVGNGDFRPLTWHVREIRWDERRVSG